jgi:serine/threonine-protein kinase
MSNPPNRLVEALADRYRIERELGAGGMATVYLAQDLKHDRKVALKVLKPELAAVLGADRFVVEIRTTAALQHPHILPLFDSGTAGGFLYYVMPFIEGETLRDRLNRETQLGIEEAVRIASEVADALDYAHRHGVIHRDIKPENILLHDGRPMVADFGIALAVSAAAGGRMTETGLSLGTPHYMSPEQATAEKDLSGRSDVYSLASVLYEMLTGDPPHTGSSAQQIIMKIITETPRPATELRKTVPANVAAALARALEKLPADRFESARAFADALKASTFRADAGARALPAAARRTTAPVATMALAATTLLAVAIALWGWLRPSPAGLVTRFNVIMDSADFISSQDAPAISPDGRKIAYSATTGGLLIRDLGSLESTPIRDFENVWSPFFSPDNESVAFMTGFPGDLVVVGLSGGAPRAVVRDSAVGWGGAWSDDGWIYFTATGGSLMRVRSDGGEPELVVQPEAARDELFIRWPVVLPGGRSIAVTLWRRRGLPDIALVDVANREMRVLRRGVRAFAVRTGHLIIVQGDGSVVAMTFDARRGEVRGEPVRVLDGLRLIYGGTVQLSISPGGTMVYSPYRGSARIVRVRRDGQGVPVAADWAGEFGSIALSPDGRQLALDQVVDGRGEIWVKTLDDGPLTRLSSGGTLTFRPFWSPDGKSVGFLSDMGGAGAPYRAALGGSGTPEPLVTIPQAVDEGAWSRDGRWLVLRTGSGGGRDLTVMEVGVDTVPRRIVATEADEYSPAISPDGRWLAYGSNQGGTDQVYVKPFPNVDAGRWQVSIGGGTEPTWSHSGRELFYRDAAGMLVSATVDPGPPFRVVSRQPLFSATMYRGDARHRAYAVSPEDQSFLFVDLQARPSAELVIVLNWFAELKRLMSRQ